jgi:hypothetical protein
MGVIAQFEWVPVVERTNIGLVAADAQGRGLEPCGKSRHFMAIAIVGY